LAIVATTEDVWERELPMGQTGSGVLAEPRLRATAAIRARLRPAVEGDESFLFSVYASTREEELAPLPWEPADKQAFLAMQFQAQHTHYHTHYEGADFDVVMLDDQPIGRLYVSRSASEIRLMDIALLREHRGTGIGTNLVEALLSEAQVTGRRVTLYVEPFNRALHLYERLGFHQTGEHGIYWFMEWVPETLP
jgi:ribosomal protein S18 acetylase RimI-like enzyme